MVLWGLVESEHHLSQEVSAKALKIPVISFWESRTACSYLLSTLGRGHTKHTKGFFCLQYGFSQHPEGFLPTASS